MSLLIKNGHILNPATDLDSVMDLLVEGDKVVKIEKDIAPEEGQQVLDAQGCYVFPGFSA